MKIRDAVEAHRKLWDWLAQNPYAIKKDWPGWDNGNRHGYIMNDCFACEIVMQHHGENFCDEESNCLFVWPHKWCETYKCDGLYEKWVDAAFGSEKRKQLAERIRDLRVRARYQKMMDEEEP